MKDSEIMQSVLDALGINANYLATKLNFNSASTVYHILKGKNSISSDMRMKIIRAYPQVNYDFLNGGQLPVILDEVSAQNQMNTFNLVPNDNRDFQMFQKFMALPDKVNRIESNIEEILRILKKEA